MKWDWKYFVFALIILLSYNVIHEYTHVTIYRIYECEDIEMNLFSASAICYNEDVLLPTAINEIIGYNIMPVLILILLFIYDGD